MELTNHADGWDRDATPMTKGEYGFFHVTIPAVNGQPAMPHNSKIKVKPITELYAHKADKN